MMPGVLDHRGGMTRWWPCSLPDASDVIRDPAMMTLVEFAIDIVVGRDEKLARGVGR